MNKCLILFAEGATETRFYKAVISYVRKKAFSCNLNISVECISAEGPWGFKNIALHKFIKRIKAKYGEECEFIVALCKDNDNFGYSPKPCIKWKEVEEAFLANGVSQVIYIKAKPSIEDWFLIDMKGILSFLGFPLETEISGNNGYDRIKMLFKESNKIYYKGMKDKGLVECLDIEKIVSNISDELIPLYKMLGL